MTRTDLSRAGWRKSSRSEINGGSSDCVEMAALDDGRVALRDSKRPHDAVLFLTHAAMAAWLSGAQAGEFDNPN